MINPDKILLVGARGYVGRSIFDKIKNHDHVYGTTSNGCNTFLSLQLDSPSFFDYRIITPKSTVLLTAAISSPDMCTREYDKAWDVNVRGTSEFIAQVMSRGGRIIFFSSDAVYGESLEVFDETKALNPAGEYAYMKAEVEKRFSGNKLFKSIRLSYIFSKDDKFVKYLVGCLEGGVSAEIFHPFYRSIIHRDDVSEGVLALVRRWDDFPQQIINFGGPDVLSRVQFAECLKENAMSRLQFHLVEPENGFFEKRPRVIAMSSNYLPMLLGRPSRSLAEAVCIEFK